MSPMSVQHKAVGLLNPLDLPMVNGKVYPLILSLAFVSMHFGDNGELDCKSKFCDFISISLKFEFVIPQSNLI